jgi:hypothetical protein
VNTPSYLTVELLQRAKAEVLASPLYKRFIDGTPLENDIAVWMADFAGQVRHETRRDLLPALERLRVEMSQHRDTTYRLGCIYALDEVRRLLAFPPPEPEPK